MTFTQLELPLTANPPVTLRPTKNSQWAAPQWAVTVDGAPTPIVVTELAPGMWAWSIPNVRGGSCWATADQAAHAALGAAA